MDRSDTGEAQRIPSRRRLFVGLTLDDATRAEAAHAAARLRMHGVRGRYVEPANYHVTVAFLGYVEERLVPDVVARLHETAWRIAPLTLRFEQVGAYPNQRRPRVVWVGPKRRDEAFAALCVSVRSALSQLGMTFDAHDDSHVTLCRCERDAAPLPRVPFRRRAARADTLTLFESRLSPHGARYFPLEVVALGG